MIEELSWWLEETARGERERRAQGRRFAPCCANMNANWIERQREET